MPIMKSLTLFLTILASVATTTLGFAPPQVVNSKSTTQLQLSKETLQSKINLATAAVMTGTSLFPMIAQAAVEADDYEYGAVDAPIGLAVGGGILAILTAAVPVLLAPGEKALDEMRENEGNRFGSGESMLDRRKK